MMQTRSERFFYRALNLVTWNTAGSALAISGTVLMVLGIIANNAFLLHRTAMILWAPANFCLLVWVVGHRLKKWNSKLSLEIIGAGYLIAFISGIYGLFIL